MNTDSENAEICMDILVKNVGYVNAQRFILYMGRCAGDYTIFRHYLFDWMTDKELNAEISKYESEHPHEIIGKQ